MPSGRRTNNNLKLLVHYDNHTFKGKRSKSKIKYHFEKTTDKCLMITATVACVHDGQSFCRIQWQGKSQIMTMTSLSSYRCAVVVQCLRKSVKCQNTVLIENDIVCFGLVLGEEVGIRGGFAVDNTSFTWLRTFLVKTHTLTENHNNMSPSPGGGERDGWLRQLTVAPCRGPGGRAALCLHAWHRAPDASQSLVVF